MKRTIIKIDEELCNGCGNCVSGCHEGALQLINGKAVMISDLYCDGLGACIGDCPVGAISLEEREAAPYDEIEVMKRLVPKGDSVILAHLKHLKEHNETEWLNQAIEYLKNNNITTVDLLSLDLNKENISNSDNNSHMNKKIGCAGMMEREIKPKDSIEPCALHSQSYHEVEQVSELRQFPVQLHLINPQSGFLKETDLLIASDCSAFACGNFHSKFLKGKSLAIACPKLDSNIQQYIDKITEIIDIAKINTITVLIMEVPCCQGLTRIATLAQAQAKRKVPIKVIVMSISGEIIEDSWI